MQEQRTPTLTERDSTIDSTILVLLTDPTSQRPWAAEELAREIGADTTDSLDRLFGAGLIHRLDRFVWASHAAIVADEIGI